MTDTAIALLGKELNNRVSSYQKRPGITQILAPFYHDDGDMHEVFISDAPRPGSWILSDFGMTLMRLSYTFDTLSEGREELVRTIATENGLSLVDGVLQAETSPATVFFDFMGMTRAITQIAALKYQKTHRSASTFIEDVLGELMEKLSGFAPSRDFLPIEDRDDLTVDIRIPARRPIFIYAARENQRYLRAGLTCSQLRQLGVDFRSLILVEDQGDFSSVNWKTVTNIVDKQFVGKSEILAVAPEYVKREVAAA